jgi:hypothetical protein
MSPSFPLGSTSLFGSAPWSPFPLTVEVTAQIVVVPSRFTRPVRLRRPSEPDRAQQCHSDRSQPSPPGRLLHGACAPVWPYDFLRTNTLFEVIHRHHMRTAWSDKHPAYDITNGNDPDSEPANVPAPMSMTSSRPKSTRN